MLALAFLFAASPSLDLLLAEAWRNNPAVARAAADVSIAEADVTTERVWLPNPELEGSVRSDVIFQNQGELALDVAVVQELSWPSARWARVDAGDQRVRAAQLRLALARLDVAADVEAAAGALAASTEAHKVRDEIAKSASAFAEAARRRVEAGAAGAVEATLANADEAFAEAQLSTAGADREAAAGNLCAVLARDECAGLSDVTWPTLSALPTAAPTSAKRADVLAARADVSAAAHASDAASLARIPGARLGVGYGYDNSVFDSAGLADDVVDPDHIIGVTLAVTLPVWDWQTGEVERARAERVRVEADARQTLLRATTTVSASLMRFHSATAAAERLEKVDADVVKALADIEHAYVAGGLALPEALATRDRLLRTRIELVDARKRKVEAHAAALRALADPSVVGIEVPQ